MLGTLEGIQVVQQVFGSRLGCCPYGQAGKLEVVQESNELELHPPDLPSAGRQIGQLLASKEFKALTTPTSQTDILAFIAVVHVGTETCGVQT